MYQQPLAPTNEVFNEIISEAKKLWRSRYSDDFGYVTEKITRLNSLSNISDDVMIAYRMFDHTNQTILREKLSEDALLYISNHL